MIDKSEHEKSRNQRLLVLVAQANQYSGVETPIPAGALLAKPNTIAATKTVVRQKTPISVPEGMSTYIASAAAPRSTIPITICSKTTGPEGSRIGQRSNPRLLGECQLQTRKATIPSSTATASRDSPPVEGGRSDGSPWGRIAG